MAGQEARGWVQWEAHAEWQQQAENAWSRVVQEQEPAASTQEQGGGVVTFPEFAAHMRKLAADKLAAGKDQVPASALMEVLGDDRRLRQADRQMLMPEQKDLHHEWMPREEWRGWSEGGQAAGRWEYREDRENGRGGMHREGGWRCKCGLSFNQGKRRCETCGTMRENPVSRMERTEGWQERWREQEQPQQPVQTHREQQQEEEQAAELQPRQYPDLWKCYRCNSIYLSKPWVCDYCERVDCQQRWPAWDEVAPRAPREREGGKPSKTVQRSVCGRCRHGRRHADVAG